MNQSIDTDFNIDNLMLIYSYIHHLKLQSWYNDVPKQ